MKIKTWRDPYEAGFSPTSPKEVEFVPGLTVLIGCNGAGKTTLLKNIKSEAKAQHIPVCSYDNLHDGGMNGLGELLQDQNYSGIASNWTSSEGELIRGNVARTVQNAPEFLKAGKISNSYERLRHAFMDEDEVMKEKAAIAKEKRRILLFDAVDSGLSLDAVVEIKLFLHQILEQDHSQGCEVYIIVSANQYELARGEMCFDVNGGRYIDIRSYEDYRKFILKSREKKEKRIDKQILYFEKKEKKRKAKQAALQAQIDEYVSVYGEHPSGWRQRDKLYNLRAQLRDLE